jgi:hypothetical protein
MAVYADDALIWAGVPNGSRVHGSRWSHLGADTPRELHHFATRALGLQRAWFQDHWPFPHYDLTEGKRAEALAKGAQPIEYGDPQALGLGRWLPPVLVTSSRDGVTVADLQAALRPVSDPRKVLICGGARGGDQIAASLWQQWGGEVDRHPVSPQAWDRSRSAGYDRNARMVAKARTRGGECVAVIARCASPGCGRAQPHGTHGTVHCAGLAEAAGLRVTRVKAGMHPQHAVPVARQGPCRYYPPGADLPEGICPGCRSSALAVGRARCQACGALQAMAATPQRAAVYTDLSHGNPGHSCVLPGAVQPQREAEAGS